MTKPEELNSVDVDKKQAILINAISHCMADNNMTLEILDYAYRDIEAWYRKNAVISQCGKADNKPAPY